MQSRQIDTNSATVYIWKYDVVKQLFKEDTVIILYIKFYWAWTIFSVFHLSLHTIKMEEQELQSHL